MAANVTKSMPAALPISILGGSPIRVAVPPMLEARIKAMRKGSGLIPSLAVIKRVTGAINITMVTLSSSAEVTAVTSTKMTRIR